MTPQTTKLLANTDEDTQYLTNLGVKIQKQTKGKPEHQTPIQHPAKSLTE